MALIPSINTIKSINSFLDYKTNYFESFSEYIYINTIPRHIIIGIVKDYFFNLMCCKCCNIKSNKLLLIMQLDKL